MNDNMLNFGNWLSQAKNAQLVGDLGARLSNQGAGGWIMPNGQYVQNPNVGGMIGQMVRDYTTNYLAAKALKGGVAPEAPPPSTAPTPTTPPAPTQAMIPYAPTGPQEFQPAPIVPQPAPVSMIPATPTPYAADNQKQLTIGSMFQDPTIPSVSGVLPGTEVGNQGVQAPMNLPSPTDVEADMLMKGIMQGPTGDAFAGVRAMNPQDMWGIPIQEQNTIMQNIIAAAAQNTAAYKAPAEAYKAVQSGRKELTEAQWNAYKNTYEAANGPGSWARIEEMGKAEGKGLGEQRAWLSEVAYGYTQPIQNPVIKALFPRCKNMGQIVESLGPKSADIMGHLIANNTAITSSSIQANALIKSMFPVMMTNLQKRQEDVGTKIYNIVTRYVTVPPNPDGSKPTTSQVIQELIKNPKAYGELTPQIQQELNFLIKQYNDVSTDLGSVTDVGMQGIGINRAQAARATTGGNSTVGNFKTEAEFNAAYKAGKVKIGDRVLVGNKPFIVQPD